MTRFRIRLLITLALFAAVATSGAATASARGSRPDGPDLHGGTVVESPRPVVRPASGEPDVVGGGTPSKFGTHEFRPPGIVKQGDHTRDRYDWVHRVWAVWLQYLIR
jgi:hypothetical protein